MLLHAGTLHCISLAKEKAEFHCCYVVCIFGSWINWTNFGELFAAFCKQSNRCHTCFFKDMKSYSGLLSYFLFVLKLSKTLGWLGKMIMFSSIPDFLQVCGTTVISPKKTSSSQHWETIIREGTNNAKKCVTEELMQFLEELKHLGIQVPPPAAPVPELGGFVWLLGWTTKKRLHLLSCSCLRFYLQNKKTPYSLENQCLVNCLNLFTCTHRCDLYWTKGYRSDWVLNLSVYSSWPVLNGTFSSRNLITLNNDRQSGLWLPRKLLDGLYWGVTLFINW